MEFLSNPYSPWFWLLWPLTLLWQNYAFTMVSRARNSGSLKRHAIASLQSNGVWFLQTLFAFTAFGHIIKGEYGWLLTAGAVAMYTAFTMAGSLYAHYQSLKKEKGLGAVGASKKYAQIPTTEWDEVRARVAQMYNKTVDLSLEPVRAYSYDEIVARMQESPKYAQIPVEEWERIKASAFGSVAVNKVG